MTSRNTKIFSCALFAFVLLFADMGVAFAQQGPPPGRPVRRGRNPSPGVPRRRPPPFPTSRVIQPSLSNSTVDEAFIVSLAQRADKTRSSKAASKNQENVLYSFVYNLMR